MSRYEHHLRVWMGAGWRPLSLAEWQLGGDGIALLVASNMELYDLEDIERACAIEHMRDTTKAQAAARAWVRGTQEAA